MLGAAHARAGTWMQVSCVNPDGSAAPVEGWSSFATGTPGFFSSTNTNCSPGRPMDALLSDAQAVDPGSGEYLQYTPPAGSTLVGGHATVNLSATGNGNFDAALAGLYEPNPSSNDGSNFYQCEATFTLCGGGSAVTGATVTLPTDRGGNLYVGADCTGTTGTQCSQGGSNGAWARAQLVGAGLLLSSGAAPQSSGFSGSALQRDASGTAHVVFTATDPGGPGVYRVAIGVGDGWCGRGPRATTTDTASRSEPTRARAP